MRINHLSEAIRYTGRWIKREDAAITTAAGAIIEIAFTGDWCEMLFDVKLNSEPFPHVYIQVDDGAKVEARIEHYMRIETNAPGNHIVKVFFKSAMEDQQRWYEPLTAKLAFIGVEAENEGVLPEDNRKIIEFIGDSITEGIWVDEPKMPYGDRDNHRNMVFQNDSTATYAYLTAKALGMKPRVMGYGSVGLTKSGGGGVPRAFDAYPNYFYNAAPECYDAEIIVINHGANDFRATEKEYVDAYDEFLRLVRKLNPKAKIVALSAFMGRYNDALGVAVEKYNKANNDDVFFINTEGWIPLEPIHPTREGHMIVAENLLKKLTEKYGDNL